MSVQHNTYVMWGVWLKYDDVPRAALEALEPYKDSAFSRKTNPKGDVTALIDGMNGEYVMLGHVIEKSSEGEGFEPLRLPRDGMRWTEPVAAALADIGMSPAACEAPAWHVLTHYR